MSHNAAGKEVKPDHEDVLERYGSFCMGVWSDGGVRVCEDTQLMEEAERVVLTRGEETHNFTLLPFYSIVNHLINNIYTTDNNTNTNNKHLININADNNTNHTSTIPSTSTSILHRLTKAFEILELLCINLFLFPWKKEFKTLKKFNAYFVYYINAVLPPQTTRCVLHHIGYDSQTHTEYRLSHSADPNRAKAMGLELFLARVECERLIQRISQKSDAECLQIIQSLVSAETLQEEPELHTAPNGVLEEDGTHNFLFPPETSLTPPDQEKSERETLEHEAFLSDDKSILEMQKDYPDLAFRQRPIFKSSSTKLKRSRGRDLKLGPKTPHAEPALKPCSSEEQQLCVESSSHTPGFTHAADASVTDLVEMMDKLKLKDFPGEEPLKCPVEETNQTVPILCCPSHRSVFSTASDPLQQHHVITEPPQSFYIPDRVSGSAAAPPAERQENPSSRAGAQPDLHNALEIL